MSGWKLCPQLRAGGTQMWNEKFSVTGPCELVHENCVASPGWPSQYGNDEQCTITLRDTARIHAKWFDTEAGFDFLTIQGTSYDGRSSEWPAGQREMDV